MFSKKKFIVRKVNSNKSESLTAHSNNAMPKALQVYQVYIGIDFGTAFTKVSYAIAPDNTKEIHSIRFANKNTSNDYYKESIIYYNATENNLLFETANNAVPIKYFKYNLIGDELVTNIASDKPLKNDRNRLFAAFYVGNIIALAKKQILEKEEYISPKTVEWYINMGVPIAEYKKDSKEDKNGIYKQVLNVAYQFAKKQENLTSINLSEFDNFYTSHKDCDMEILNTVPELYAEVSMYQESNNVPEGFYAVVDIGGGTTDIATFHKYQNNGEMKADCISQKIEPIGFDVLIQNIVKDGIDIDTVRNIMLKPIFFDVNAMKFKTDETKIDHEKLHNCFCQFREAYGSCITEAYQKQKSAMGKQKAAANPLFYFMLGGGSNVSFYAQSINYMTSFAHTGLADLQKAQQGDIYEYLNDIVLESRKFTVKDSRLLISQVLAQPFELISEVKNFPWSIATERVEDKSEAYKEKLAERLSRYND